MSRHHAPAPVHPGEQRHHRHDWTWVEPTADDVPGYFACTSCEETTSPCSDCSRPLETSATICARCLKRAKDLVDECEAAYDSIPGGLRTVMGLRAVRYDAGSGGGSRDSLPFGIGADQDVDDELVALLARYQTGTVIHLMRDPVTVMSILESWADDWAEKSNRPVRVSTFDYLREHSLWAAQNHPSWHQYLEEVRGVRSKLQAIAGTRPVPEPAPCPHCGGRVVREWGREGLDDQRHCTGCRRSWQDDEQLVEDGRQVLAAMPSTNPDLLVTRDEGRRLVPDLSANLLRQVIFRDRHRADPSHRAYDPTWVPRLPVQEIRGGKELYRLADVMCVRWSPRTDAPSPLGTPATEEAV